LKEKQIERLLLKIIGAGAEIDGGREKKGGEKFSTSIR